MSLKEKLLAIADGDLNVQGWDYSRGLCSNIARELDHDGSHVDSVLMPKWTEDWPYFSGEPLYPVPHNEKELKVMRFKFRQLHYKTDHQLMYDGSKQLGKLYSGHYGEMRRDLARHVAGKLNG